MFSNAIQMSWPVSSDRALHTVLMMEARSLTPGWLVTNIPRTNVSAGLTIMDYTQHPQHSGEGSVMSSLSVQFSLIVEDDPVKLILVFEQNAPLRDQDYGQWRRRLGRGVDTLENTLNLRLLAANFWRETGSTQHG